jgi:hypothetical protein
MPSDLIEQFINVFGKEELKPDFLNIVQNGGYGGMSIK